MTTVVHFRKAPYDIYIGRPSKWGNPHPTNVVCPLCNRHHTRSEAIQLYEAHILSSPDLLAALPELKDKRLGCWCAPKACHGDVLVKLLQTDRLF